MRYTAEQMNRLAALEKAGRLTAESLVDDARNPGSPLHELFEWDNERAAHEYRIEQARGIIRTVEYRFERRTITYVVPRYVPDPATAANQPGYVAIDTLAKDRALAVKAVRDEVVRALGYIRRAEGIGAALDCAPELAALTKQAQSIRDALDDGGAAVAVEAAG